MALLSSLADAYARVFGDPPWCETWERARVLEKLSHDLSSPEAFLTLLVGNDPETVVGGFCWGAIIPVAEIPKRVRDARSIEPTHEAQLDAVSQKIRAPRILFVDELALMDRFRSGIGPIAAICVPLLRMADTHHVGVMCWTSDDSKIVAILRAYKFKSIATLGSLRFLWASHRTVRMLNPVAQQLATHG